MSDGDSRILGGERAQSLMSTQLRQYGVALLSVAVALGSTLLLGSYLEPTPTPLFFVAVIVSAWYGGVKPGIAATILSTLAINYFLLEPVYTLTISDLGTLVRLGVFVMAALLINSLNESQRAARQKAEASFQSLRESEARFGCLAESNIIGMIVAELDGAILEANHNFLQLVGYTQEELRAGRLNWQMMTSPESLESSERAVRELLTTGACTPFEKAYIHKDGSRVPVLHGAVMTGKATVTGFVLDLSERKRLEAIQQQGMDRERSLYAEVQAANAKLETVLTSLNDQFLVLDHEWRYVYVSDHVVEVVGRPKEELLGKCIWELFPETVDSQFYHEAQRAVTEQKIVQFEYFYSPWQRWFENRVYPSSAGVSILVTDITDRKQAETKLQRTNQTLQTLLDACPVAIAFFDPHGIVQLWNRAAERIFGWSAEEVIGQFIPTVPHRRQEFLNSIQTVLNGRSLEGIEAQHQRKDGSMVDLEIWASLIHDAEGNPGCLGIAWDITERKQTEAALRQSDRRFKSVFNQQFQYIAILTPEGRIVDVNESPLKATGVKREDVLGQLFWETSWWEPLPEMRALWVTHVAQVAQGGAPVTGETYYATADGTLRFSQYVMTAVKDETDQVVNLIIQASDLTDRKQAEMTLRQSEERYRYLAETIPQLVWTADADGQIMDTNQRWLTYTGVTLAQIQSTGWQAIVHPDDIPTLSQQWVAAQQAGIHYRAEGRMQRADGAYRWHLHEAIPLKNQQGQVVKWFGTATDIEDQKQLEHQRQRLLEQEQAAREQAETANRIKDEFLAVLSHELRSPLNPILGWSKLLQTQKLDEQKTQQALATIERNAKLQTQLIEDLLDVSRILRGKLVLNIAPVSLTSTIEAALETVRLAVEAKGIHIQKVFNLDDDQVMGDAARLQQVIWNLLTNAVKFTPSGGRVEVRLERVEEVREYGKFKGDGKAEGYAQITVTDTGKGINSNFLPYVFDYFRQEDGTTTRKFGGLGLGLAIVRHITELHGGTVSAESLGEGLGATFTVRLPLMGSRELKVGNGQNADALRSISYFPLANIRILAVDDDADIRELIGFVLEQAGAEVRVVASATEVLQELKTFSPEVLISDVGMPDFDGYMLIRQVRNLLERGTISAIALTAYAGEIDQQQAIEAGFQMHLAKPVEPEQLIDAIVTLLDERKAKKSLENG